MSKACCSQPGAQVRKVHIAYRGRDLGIEGEEDRWEVSSGAKSTEHTWQVHDCWGTM